MDREAGTVYNYDDFLFLDFDGGAVFDYSHWNNRDMSEMFERDGKARTLEQAISLPERRAPWSIEKGEAREEVRQFVEDELRLPSNAGGMSTPMQTVIGQMVTAAIYKVSFFERVFHRRDNRVVYKKIAWRPQQTCSVLRDPRTGAFRGFKQHPVRYGPHDTKEVRIKPETALVHFNGQHRDPVNGVSEFEVVFNCYQVKQKIRFLWFQFLESQSLPKTIVYGTSPAEADKAARRLIGLKQGGVVGMVKGQHEHAVLESSGAGAQQFQAAMSYLDQEASGSLLAQFTDLGAAAKNGAGSFALSKDQTDFFLMSRQASLDEKALTLNQYLLPDLVRYNFGPNEKIPQFRFGRVSETEIDTTVSLLQGLAAARPSAAPHEFVAELTERTAEYLDLDTTKVKDGLKEAAEQAKKMAEMAPAPGPQTQETNKRVAEVAGPVQAATNAVKRKQRKQQEQ